MCIQFVIKYSYYFASRTQMVKGTQTQAGQRGLVSDKVSEQTDNSNNQK